MKNLPEIHTFKESYINVFINLQESQREVLWWFLNFVLLFLMPIIWPAAWFAVQLNKFGRWMGK